MQTDIIEKLGNSTIQHGKYNDRIYAMKIDPEEAQSLPQMLIDKARQCKYSKIFAKVPAGCAPSFVQHGFSCEAEVTGFFGGCEAALMLSYPLQNWRAVSATADRNEQVLDACRKKQAETTKFQHPEAATLRICRSDDVETMAEVYAEVFPTYPFPIDDPAYLRETMASQVAYFGIWFDGKLAALSSAEMDKQARNVEMTDFATLPDHRGQGLATILLDAMEKEMRGRNMATAYTIARAPSFGMNTTFARMGYHFAGRLINNTNIGGQFEDMNVWYKHLQKK